MKLLRYGPLGKEKPGLLDANDTIRDLSGLINDLDPETISSETFAKIAAIDPESLPVVDGSPRIGACVGKPGKYICIGLNYSDHAAEAGMELPPEPIVFFKATSAVCGPNDT
ncbi:MAG: ureidoglycolate lyase, partial [Pseudomonadales bacterium]